MRVTKTDRGFEVGTFTDRNGQRCELQQSSAIDGNRPGALSHPGTSFVWLGVGPDVAGYGTRMHLDRAMVVELVNRLDAWLKNGSFLFSNERHDTTGGA
jgi:hypothetical protein